MTKDEAINILKAWGLDAYLDQYSIVMMRIKGKSQKKAQKLFNSARKALREEGYAGSVGYLFSEVANG